MSNSGSPIEIFYPGRFNVKIISDILLWTTSHGQAMAVQPERTYIQQISADARFSLEDHPPEAMDDRDGWRKRVRDILAGCAT